MTLVTKAEHEGILYEFKKRWQMKQEKYSNQWKIFREITAKKSQAQHAAQSIFADIKVYALQLKQKYLPAEVATGGFLSKKEFCEGMFTGKHLY